VIISRFFAKKGGQKRMPPIYGFFPKKGPPEAFFPLNGYSPGFF